MVYNPVQYVRFDTFGSAARKIIHAPAAPKAVLPKAKKQKRKVIYIDPVACLSIAVAVCMVLTMTIGIFQFLSARREAARMESYVAELYSRNEVLSQEYESGYDIVEIEKSARALGMVPKDQVQSVSIQVTAPQQTETMSLWERVGTFLTSLFA